MADSREVMWVAWKDLLSVVQMDVMMDEHVVVWMVVMLVVEKVWK